MPLIDESTKLAFLCPTCGALPRAFCVNKKGWVDRTHPARLRRVQNAKAVKVKARLDQELDLKHEPVNPNQTTYTCPRCQMNWRASGPGDAAFAIAVQRHKRLCPLGRAAPSKTAPSKAGGSRPGAGRPPLSRTGERRVKVPWAIAPRAIDRITRRAAALNQSVPDFLEAWALDLPDAIELIETHTSPSSDGCRAAGRHSDGDCVWTDCPQLRDGEPERSGRHCPLDIESEEI